jgi:hypothetical protein
MGRCGMEGGIRDDGAGCVVTTPASVYLFMVSACWPGPTRSSRARR